LAKASGETTKNIESNTSSTMPTLLNKRIEKLIESIVLEEERQEDLSKNDKKQQQQQQFQKRITINEHFLKTIENDVKDRIEESNKNPETTQVITNQQQQQQRLSYYDLYNVISSSSSQSVSSSSTSSLGLTSTNQQQKSLLPQTQINTSFFINPTSNITPLPPPLTLSTTTTSKLKKFNINYTPLTPSTAITTTMAPLLTLATNNGITDDEKQKQQEILLKNQLEKEKNQQLIRQIISTKQKPIERKLSSSSLLSHQKLCNSCQKQTCYITERIILNGLIFHRDCIRCFICNANINDFKQAISMSDKLKSSEKSK
jgi:hypothetical protein